MLGRVDAIPSPGFRRPDHDQGFLSRRRTLRWHLEALRARFPDEALHGSPPVPGVQELNHKTVWEMSGGEERRADQVVWMVAGTTHCLGTPEDAMNHEQFRKEYLGPGF